MSQFFLGIVPNELRYEKEAENRATIYHPKTPLKGEWKLQFYWCSAFFYDRVLALVVLSMYFHQIAFIKSSSIDASNTIYGKHKHTSV